MRTLVNVLLALSVAFNVWLGRQVFELRWHLKAALSSPRVSVGDSPSAIDVRDLENATLSLNFDRQSQPMLVYFMSPSCQWCQRNRDHVAALADQVKDRYRIVGIVIGTDDLTPAASKEYVVKQALPFPVYIASGDDVARTFKLRSVPTTLVIAEGKVTRLWEGGYDGGSRQEIEHFFSARLAQEPASVSK